MDVVWAGSMCSGIGGIELGLAAAFAEEGMDLRVRWMVEQDEYCRSILRRHFPNTKILEDVNSEETKKWVREFPVTVCSFGFPCQDLSVAGHQKGIHGSRSGLFFRCWELAVLARSRYVFMENVPALLAAGRGYGDVLSEVAKSGYNLQWTTLSAAACGARHKRDRWWGVAYKDTGGSVDPYLPW